MKLGKAKRLARKLLDAHGFITCRVSIDNSDKENVGSCWYHTKTLWMNKSFVREFGYQEIKQTVLHEIAHIYVLPHCPNRGPCPCVPRRGCHNSKWQKKAKELGVKLTGYPFD